MKLRRRLAGKYNRAYLNWILIFAALVSCVSLPSLVAKSQFVDSLTYSAIAKDMAFGKSSLWNYYFTSYETLFRGHPPFVMWVESLFFKLFYTSDILPHFLYSLCILIANIIGIKLIWSLLFPQRRREYLFILFFWYLTPLIYWSFSNNLLDNTLSATILFSTFFSLKGVIKKNTVFTILSALFCFLAFLTKGLVGFFPLTVIPLFYVIYRTKHSFIHFFIFISTLSLFILFIYFNDSANSFFSDYFNIQVYKSITGQREVNSWGHFYIIQKLAIELTPMLLIILILRIKNRLNYTNKKEFLLLLSLGLFSSLPLSISPKAHGFYLVPSIPFFAMSLYSITNINFTKINDFLYKKYIVGFTFICFIGCVFFVIKNYSIVNRDMEKIEFASEVRQIIPYEIKQVSLARNLEHDYYLRAFFTRYYDIRTELDTSFNYHIISSQDVNNYEVLTETENFALIKK